MIDLVHLIASAHAAIVKIFQASVVRVVFKRHRWVEHFNHLTWLLKFTSIVTGAVLRYVRYFRLILFNKADLCLEDLAGILVLHLVLIPWLFNRRSELLWSDLIVACHWFWIYDVD